MNPLSFLHPTPFFIPPATPSCMKYIDVSSCYFFLVVIIDKPKDIYFMTACKIQFHFIHMYIYKISSQTMGVWLDMSDGFHTVLIHHKAELSTISC